MTTPAGGPATGGAAAVEGSSGSGTSGAGKTSRKAKKKARKNPTAPAPRSAPESADDEVWGRLGDAPSGEGPAEIVPPSSAPDETGAAAEPAEAVDTTGAADTAEAGSAEAGEHPTSPDEGPDFASSVDEIPVLPPETANPVPESGPDSPEVANPAPEPDADSSEVANPVPDQAGPAGAPVRSDVTTREGSADRRTAVIVALAVLVVLLAGALAGILLARHDVFRDTLDATAVQRGVTNVVTDDWRRSIRDVDCPSGEVVRVGTAFTCHATVDGRGQDVPVTVTADDGTYEVGQPR